MANATLLVELLTEELPPKALKALGQAFADRIVSGLQRVGLAEMDDPAFETFATPRRLGVRVMDVRAQAADRDVREKLMPKSVALDAQGNPTEALRKRLAKVGRAHLADCTDFRDGSDSLSFEGEGKTATAFLLMKATGRPLAIAIEGIVDDAIAKLPIPKRMTYQRYDDAGVETLVQFVRPAHALVAMHGTTVLPVRALGLQAGNRSEGHRFIGARHVSFASADEYEAVLRGEGKVIARFDERRDAIRAGLLEVAADDRIVMPDALLDEVTALVEWPAVYRGTFDAAFLDVPQECLILTMQQNQKYFALTDASGVLVNRFLLVSNIESANPVAIVGGNERVLRARLADAKFFYDQDRKRTLESRVESLKSVVYHNKLGSQYERMRRVEALAGTIAAMLDADADDARQAARLAKADLVTDMVGEFPELQGLMGRYYALHDGAKPDVAAAVEEQYKPRFAGDTLPSTPTGTALALADKFETLAGMFSIGAAPTGDKDPFALRRHALGIVRLLIEKSLSLSLESVVGAAVRQFDLPAQDVAPLVDHIIDFMRTRAAGYGRDLGYSTNEVESALHADADLSTLQKRWSAVSEVSSRPEFLALAAANKRVGNILRKSEGSYGHALSPHLLTEPAEKDLYAALSRIDPRLDQAIHDGDFLSALLPVAELREPVDAFFEHVMVNVDDVGLRNNRLALLASLESSMNRVADISKLAA